MNEETLRWRDELSEQRINEIAPQEFFEGAGADLGDKLRVAGKWIHNQGFDAGFVLGLEQANEKIKELEKNIESRDWIIDNLEAKIDIAVEALDDVSTMKYGNNILYAVMERMNFRAREALEKIRGEK